jgi:hypothetical protein
VSEGAEPASTCGDTDSRFARRFAQPSPNQPLDTSARGDADLARIILAWPHLPDHIKAAVLALVRTAQ